MYTLYVRQSLDYRRLCNYLLEMHLNQLAGWVVVGDGDYFFRNRGGISVSAVCGNALRGGKSEIHR